MQVARVRPSLTSGETEASMPPAVGRVARQRHDQRADTCYVGLGWPRRRHARPGRPGRRPARSCSSGDERFFASLHFSSPRVKYREVKVGDSCRRATEPQHRHQPVYDPSIPSTGYTAVRRYGSAASGSQPEKCPPRSARQNKSAYMYVLSHEQTGGETFAGRPIRQLRDTLVGATRS